MTDLQEVLYKVNRLSSGVPFNHNLLFLNTDKRREGKRGCSKGCCAHQIIVRKFFISSITNEDMNSGFTGEKGESDSGGRLVSAFL